MTSKAAAIIDKYYPEGTRLRDIYLCHCRQVADLAKRINEHHHLSIDPDVLDDAAMLHDIGIYATDADGIDCHGAEPYIRHGIIGAELLRREGMAEEIARVAERHTGAGITADDVRSMQLPLPQRDYMPETLLEKVVCYADKFYSKTRLEGPKSLDHVRRSMLKHSPETLARFEHLHSTFAIDRDTHKARLAIVNTDPIDCTYGGVAPIMRNMHPLLSRAFEVNYIYLPERWRRMPGLGRIKVMLYVWSQRKHIRRCDFVLSHIPEGSYVVSHLGVPYSHIYHGNTNPMEGSKYWFGKYFKFVFEHFFRRIARTCKLRYTVGPTFDDVKKLPNPIRHSVKPTPTADRRGFIFAGRLESGKNIDRIIEVYASLPEDIRRDNNLFIAGTGTQEARLKQLAADTGLGDKIIFLGNLPNDDLVTADSTKHILLMASGFEGFPTAIAEALSVGVPVVTTSVGDIPRYVKDGVNGRLLPYPFDNEEYIRAITDILNDYERYSAEALASAAVFDCDTITRSVIDDINKHLNSSAK